MNFFDSVNNNIHILDINHYMKFIDEIVHGQGGVFSIGRLYDLAFSIYDICGKGSICEHDIF